MFHVKLLTILSEGFVVGAIWAQVAQGQPSGTTVVVGLLGVVIAMQWGQSRKLAAIEERLKPLASREWTKDLVRNEIGGKP